MNHCHQHNNLIISPPKISSTDLICLLSYHPSLFTNLWKSYLHLLSPMPHLPPIYYFPFGFYLLHSTETALYDNQWRPSCKMQRTHNVHVFIFTDLNRIQYIEWVPHFFNTLQVLIPYSFGILVTPLAVLSWFPLLVFPLLSDLQMLDYLKGSLCFLFYSAFFLPLVDLIKFCI